MSFVPKWARPAAVIGLKLSVLQCQIILAENNDQLAACRRVLAECLQEISSLPTER